MSTELKAKLEMDPKVFSQWVRKLAETYHPDLEVLVLSEDEESLIHYHFFRGELNDVVKYQTDKNGVIRMYLAGIKTMFSPRITVSRPLMVFAGYKPKNTNPVCPKPIGPKPRGPGLQDHITAERLQR